MTAAIGHNTGTAPDAPATTIVAKDRLRAIVERIERVESDMKELADGRKDIYAEAKSGGYDCKALRKLVSIRREDANKRAEMQAILETYMHAMGMGLDA